MEEKVCLIKVITDILGMKHSLELENVKLLRGLMEKVNKKEYIRFLEDYDKASVVISDKLYNDQNRTIISSILYMKLLPISRNIERIQSNEVLSNYSLFLEYLDQTYIIFREFTNDLCLLYGYDINASKEVTSKKSLKSYIRSLIK